jgi:nonsense-mediated mRNA decay protein 3
MSGKQVGEDLHSGTLDMRFSISVRVPPLNRQDLVILPPRYVRGTGNQSFIAIVHKIARKIKMVDPVTANVIDVDAATYWDRPFGPALSLSSLHRFVVITIDPIGPKSGRFQLADVELADEETYAERVLVRSHLGAHLKEGDVCLAYDVRASVLPDDAQLVFAKQNLPEVVVAGRAPPTDERKQRKRVWHVKELAPRGSDEEKEFDEFLDDIENDPELRQDIEIYKNEDVADDNPDLRASIIGMNEMKVDDGSVPYAFLPEGGG